jgi:hypothetical protein
VTDAAVWARLQAAPEAMAAAAGTHGIWLVERKACQVAEGLVLSAA